MRLGEEAIRALLEPVGVRRELAQLAGLVDDRIERKRDRDVPSLERRARIAAEKRPTYTGR